MSAENPQHHLNLGTIGWCHTKFYQVTTIIRIVWLTVRRGANLIWELKGYTQVVRDVQVQSGLKGISFLCKPCHFKWLTDNNNNIISEWVINHYSHGSGFMNWLTFFFSQGRIQFVLHLVLVFPTGSKTGKFTLTFNLQPPFNEAFHSLPRSPE